MSDFLEIDGSVGEGGGQILRSCLTLSILKQKPFVIRNIRANRSEPGLKAQHLTAVEAASYISQATVEGNKLGSQEMSFIPGECVPGNYFFNIKTAGAISLVLQTVYLPLALSNSPSTITVKGGTHVPFSPIFEYLQKTWGSAISLIHNDINFEIENAGFYPKGGGSCKMHIQPHAQIQPISSEGKLKKLHITAVISKLPEHVAIREIETIKKFLKTNSIPAKVSSEIQEYRAFGSANFLFLDGTLDNGLHVGFTEMGKRGRPAEQVAESLGKTFLKYWKSKSMIEEHLADQLLLPLSFSDQPSRFSVSGITQHLRTNADVIQKFMDVTIKIHGDKSGIVEIFP